jgi:protein-L-isoaspartate(D-aspartate) O-methyltransferase
MNVSSADETIRAAGLREAMVEEMRKLGAIRSESVATAVGTVPRHLFAPGEPLERTYAAKTILQTKRDGRGVAISMISIVRIGF